MSTTIGLESPYGTPTSLNHGSPTLMDSDPSFGKPRTADENDMTQVLRTDLGGINASAPDTQWIDNLYADLVYMPQSEWSRSSVRELVDDMNMVTEDVDAFVALLEN